LAVERRRLRLAAIVYGTLGFIIGPLEVAYLRNPVLMILTCFPGLIAGCYLAENCPEPSTFRRHWEKWAAELKSITKRARSEKKVEKVVGHQTDRRRLKRVVVTLSFCLFLGVFSLGAGIFALLVLRRMLSNRSGYSGTARQRFKRSANPEIMRRQIQRPIQRLSRNQRPSEERVQPRGVRSRR
jgi:hypothetical protein